MAIADGDYETVWDVEPVSKRFSWSKVKDGANFNHRNTARISRIKIGARRRDWVKWDVLKLAHEGRISIFHGRKFRKFLFTRPNSRC
jgi:hypothetical protein